MTPRRLDAAAESTGTTVAAIVSEAADAYVAGAAPAGMKAILDETFGSMPDLDVPARSEWDR